MSAFFKLRPFTRIALLLIVALVFWYLDHLSPYRSLHSTLAAQFQQPDSPLPPTPEPLLVVSANPKRGSINVWLQSQIEVVFNQPVVHLDAFISQAELPQPLQIEPSLAGTGEWVGDNAYIFRPKTRLAGASKYQVTVQPFANPKGLILREIYSFTFTTAMPQVEGVEPAGLLVAPQSAVKVRFNQSMDQDSTLAAFSLRGEGSGLQVAGTISWTEESSVLSFFPNQPLQAGETYLVELTDSSLSANRQGHLVTPYRAQFGVAPLPVVEWVDPVPELVNVWYQAQVGIHFSTLMSPTTVLEHLHVAPLLSGTQVYSSYSEPDRFLSLSWPKEARTTYTVTLDGAMLDLFGNRLGDSPVDALNTHTILSPTLPDRSLSFTFTTGDLPAFLNLNLGSVTHLSAYTDTRVNFFYRNISQTTVNLYQLPIGEFYKLAGSANQGSLQNYELPDAIENRLWQRRYALSMPANLIGSQAISLTDANDQRLPPGLYLVEAIDTTGDTGGFLAQGMVVLSDYNLVVKRSSQGASLAWLTDLSTGQPVGNQPLTFLSNGYFAGNGATNADGLFWDKLAIDRQTASNLPLMAIAGKPGDSSFAVASTGWSEDIGLWEFGLGYSDYEQPYVSHFYTDRPIYRPGQTIYWKGLIRRWRDDQYALPNQSLPIEIAIRDSQGMVISRTTLYPNSFGTLTGGFELSPEAVTGSYYLEAAARNGPLVTFQGGVGFVVAAYRKPEFAIQVTSDQPEYIHGDTMQIKVDAHYFSGGALADAQVEWRLLPTAYAFAWQPPAADRWYTFAPFQPDTLEENLYGIDLTRFIKEGKGRTDENGQFLLDLPADLADSLVSQQWMLNVTVQSGNNQFVDAQLVSVIHRSHFYLGISPQSYVVKSGEKSLTDLIAITPAGKPYPTAKLDVTVYEYRWNSVYARQPDGLYRWENNLEQRAVLSESVKTDSQGRAQVAWQPKQGGQYRILASGKDAEGNPTNSASYLWVSDANPNAYAAWPQRNDERIEPIADKKHYRPGDTAHILIPSPFSGTVQALVTVERGGVLQAQTITFTSNSATFDLLIDEQYAPSVYLSVVLIKPADADEPIALMRVGYLQLLIDSRAKALQIDVRSSAAKAYPGDTVTYTLKLRDFLDKPAAHSEVSVALIDKAIFSILEDDQRSLLDVFYAQRGLGVLTGATLVINRDRLSQQLREGQKGGGGGGGDGAVRERFPDLAWWHANLVSNATGEIQFSLKLPDNLTTWVLLVKAIDAKTNVGEARHELVVSKDLQVRPIVPRFFTAGDQAMIGAILVNGAAQPLSHLQFSVEIAGGSWRKPSEALPDQLANNQQTRIEFPLTVYPTATQVVFTYTARAQVANLPSQTLFDSVRITVPVNRYIVPEGMSLAGRVSGTVQSERIVLPKAAAPDAQIVVNLEGSLAAGLIDSLSYLEHYPYECNEQTLSRFLPNLLSARTLDALGIQGDRTTRQLKDNLTRQVWVGVQRLVSRQNLDGGWGYWPGEQSQLFTTAYVMWGLAQMQRMNYPVSQAAIERGISYLEQQPLTPDTAEEWELNAHAFKNLVLAELGHGDPGRMSVLFDYRIRLSLYGKAYLALAMSKIQPSGRARSPAGQPFAVSIATLLEELMSEVQEEAWTASWHEAQPDWRSMGSDTRTTAIILESLIQLAPDLPILPKVVRWLMQNRQQGIWGNTQESAWSIIALSDWMSATGELQGDYTWRVELNGEALGNGTVNAEHLRDKVELRRTVVQLFKDHANWLQFFRSNDSGQLYYTAWLRYSIDALAVQPQDNGFGLARRFEVAGKPSEPIAVGDLISVTLLVKTAAPRYHVAIQAPIAAGSEIIDPRWNWYSAPTLSTPLVITETSGFTTTYQSLWSNYIDVRDDKLLLFTSYLPAGNYYYTFTARATISGRYRILPVHAQMMYAGEVSGHSAGEEMVIR